MIGGLWNTAYGAPIIHIFLSIFVPSSLLLKDTEIHVRAISGIWTSISHVTGYCFMVTLSLVFYFVTSIIDPGFVEVLPRTRQILHLTLSEADHEWPVSDEFPELHHCGFCGIEQPLRARHCEDCGRCVRRFDHHCPWLSCCIGERNHRFFLLFLLTTKIAIIWSLLLAWRAISYQEHASQFLLKNLVFLIDLGVILIGGCSTLCLTVMHLYVAIFNVTTWEFMSSHRISYLKDCDYSQSPFHLGYLQNFLVFMFAGNVQDWKAIYQKNFKKSNPECLLVV